MEFLTIKENLLYGGLLDTYPMLVTQPRHHTVTVRNKLSVCCYINKVI